ncbi:MAG: thiol:disulfide interchange protein DsbA/DsbL [Pseudomonas sp.]|nr:MAG: thiol:disulfide interchange protein DsbA/DsbL [Pseudomonas sp.]
MNRRSFLVQAGALLAVPALASAQKIAPSQAQMPFREVGFRLADSRKVLCFFSFTCPVCAAYHASVAQWGESLPPGWKLEFVPVTLPQRETVIAARAYFAALMADSAKIYDFVGSAYTQIQQHGMKQDDPRTWAEAARIARITRFEENWGKISTGAVKKPYDDLIAYQVSATPSLVIGGRYVITPDDTNGDRDLFFRLAAAMVSKSM